MWLWVWVSKKEQLSEDGQTGEKCRPGGLPEADYLPSPSGNFPGVSDDKIRLELILKKRLKNLGFLLERSEPKADVSLCRASHKSYIQGSPKRPTLCLLKKTSCLPLSLPSHEHVGPPQFPSRQPSCSLGSSLIKSPAGHWFRSPL